MGRKHVDAILCEVVIEPITVVGPIPNGILGFGLQHVAVETELNQLDLMMIGRMRAHREREPMPIHKREDFDAFAPAGFPDVIASALGRGKRRIDESLALVNRSSLPERIRRLCENRAQHLSFAPLLKPTMDRLVVGTALREHVPLCAGIQNPQDTLQDGSRRYRLATGTTFQDVFLARIIHDT